MEDCTDIVGIEKGDFDATSNYSAAAVVRRRRRLLRVFQMGHRRWTRDSRYSRAHRGRLILPRLFALTLPRLI